MTLLEMLIVLVVIAVAAGATLLSLGPRRGDPAEVEARRLAATISASADRSIATGAAAALVVDAHGYAVTGSARHDLPDGVELRGAGGPVLPLGLDASRPFDLVVVARGDGWRVAFDGVRVDTVAARAPA